LTDNVKVSPSTRATSVDIATDEIDNVHYPIYKVAVGPDGEATLIDEDNPLPIANEPAVNSTVITLLGELIIEMKIMNAYNALGHDAELTSEDIKK
jgi:hypothetical protein